jgi:hypothetical protein
MKRLTNSLIGFLTVGMGTMTVLAGEASTNASAGNLGGPRGGTAAATARYDGSDGGIGLARTRTGTGDVNFARGLAVGVDEDGLDLSFSHAIADRSGPAYAGTFNLSIGNNGDVSGSYGGAFSQGGRVRSAEAGGSTRTDWRAPVSTATARGDASPGGRVTARTHSYTRPVAHRVASRTARPIWR